jgi:hypothetical protein
VVTISNPGPWNGQRAGGEGLRMVHKRTALAYPDGSAGLTIGAAGDRTLAELTVPLGGPHPGSAT